MGEIMNASKKWYQSRSVLSGSVAAIVTAVAFVGRVLGYEMGDTSEVAAELTTLAGAVMAVYWRIKANATIGK